MSPRTEYVVGFLFRASGNQVALITKARPAWQRGKLNGPGGKMEKGEAPFVAMKREWREETGTVVEDWRFFCRVAWPTAVVYFFSSHASIEGAFRNDTDEPVRWYGLNDLTRLPVVKSLLWLIPLALDPDAPVLS